MKAFSFEIVDFAAAWPVLLVVAWAAYHCLRVYLKNRLPRRDDPTQSEHELRAAIARMKARPTTCTPEILEAFNDPSLPEISGKLRSNRKRKSPQ